MVSVEPDRLLVCEALAQLSAADRGVLRRSYYRAGRPRRSHTICTSPEGTVKMKLHYTVRALQRRLQQMGVPNSTA